MSEFAYDLQSYNGWRFCPHCKNLLNPFKETENPEVLQFKCSSNKCGNQVINSFNLNLKGNHSC